MQEVECNPFYNRCFLDIVQNMDIVTKGFREYFEKGLKRILKKSDHVLICTYQPYN